MFGLIWSRTSPAIILTGDKGLTRRYFGPGATFADARHSTSLSAGGARHAIYRLDPASPGKGHA
ncbi:MAG: hypothetical protein CL534_25530 [Ahrensia sp.]|nr:hypothetical protein [Ahrensia sp.]